MLRGEEIVCAQKRENQSSNDVRHDTMKLMQLFLGENNKIAGLKVKPSAYLQQMQMSMEQRLDQLSKPIKRPQRYCDYHGRKDCKDFKITPSVLVFQSFVPGRHYSAKLTVINIAKVSRPLALGSETSPVFSVSYQSKVITRMAPGMAVTFLVKFSPVAHQDYFHNMVIKTENDFIDVPIMAMGPRPLVNFPDSLDLKETLVRVPLSKSFHVKNIGQLPAIFNLRCQRPFSVDPEKCILEVGKIAMITITIHAETVDDFFKEMFVNFETGEEIVVELTGYSKNGRIWLNCEKLHFDDTFMGLKRQKKVTLYNDCNSAIRFSWHHCQTLLEDMNRLESLKESLNSVRVTEAIRSAKLEYHNIIREDDQKNIYSRIYSDEVNQLSLKDTQFSNKNFQIDPIIIAANKGDIASSVKFVSMPLVFGGCLTCEPESQCLQPFEVKSFIISFSTQRTGKFLEEIKFQITQSEEERNITLKGSVVNPTITFDKNKVDFGIVPVGFPETQSVNLVNESQVPVEFSLRVPGDGTIPPLLWSTFAETSDKPALETCCCAFNITPNTGVIGPNSLQNIKIMLVTNMAVKNISVLMAENKNSKLPQSVSLPMSYESQVATIVCEPAQLHTRFCFINHEYSYPLRLVNTSKLSGYFYIPPQLKYPAIKVVYKTDICEGLLEPGASAEIIITILPLTSGLVTEEVMMLTFGASVLAPVCEISCSAQGPNVSSSVEALDFGKMTLMESKTLTFELINNSPITAEFHASAEEKQQTIWVLEPSDGGLMPWGVITLSVTLTVLDPGNINMALLVHVNNSRTLYIGLSATASGCGIVITPNVFPEINLGYLFSRRLYQIQLNVSNPGSRHHFLQFIPERISHRASASPLNFFKFTPNKFELAGGAKTVVILEGQNNREMEVSESFFCWAIINKRGLKQNLGSILVKATFISPMVEVSSTALEFEINVGPDDCQSQVAVQSFSVRSVTHLPMTVILELTHPFIILEGSETFTETVVSLCDSEEVVFRIGFQPPIQPCLYCSVYFDELQITFKEHPQKESVQLKGKLNFPNLKISHHRVDFGCIPLDFQGHQEVVITNPTPLPVNFSFSWDPDSIMITYFETEKEEDIVGSEFPEELFLDPLQYNRQLPSLKDKESLLEPIPLVYLEPVPEVTDQTRLSHRPTFQKFHQEHGEDQEEKREIHKLLFPAVKSYFYPERQTPEFNILPDKPHPVPMISQMFDLTPMSGVLRPHQSQVVNVAFRPTAFMGVAATLVCSVLGGPTETIRLSGQSARHIYKFSTTFISFGFRSFMEPCDEVITLSNLSQLPFQFQVQPSADHLSSPSSEDIHVGKITVNPASGEVASLTSTKITVRFFPGLAGEFQQTFTVQIGYLEPVNVLVTGFGLLPQVTLNLMRVSRPRVPIGWMYQAVASLTAKRFHRHISERYSFKPAADHDLDDDWVYIDFSDGVPTNDDIWFAIEWVIAYNFVKDNSMDLNHLRKGGCKTIPQLFAPGYVLDLGTVILGMTTECTFLLENKGLIEADVYLAPTLPEKRLKLDGFSFSFPHHINLPVGRSVPLNISINPTDRRHSKEGVVHFILNVQVINGSIVPIFAKALLTVPCITVDQKIVNFGNVQCGHCKKICILLKNCGAVDAEWTASLKHPHKKKSPAVNYGNEFPEHEMPFSIRKSNGIFPPNTAGILEISFLPKEEKLYETVLTLSVKHNPQNVSVKLQGPAIEPKIKITPETIQFGCHIPYSGKMQKVLKITNISPVTIKVCFSDFDSDIMEEDRILRVLTHLYGCEKMMLPLDLYNIQPSYSLKEFYNSLVRDPSAIFTENNGSGSFNRYTPTVMNSQQDSSRSSPQPGVDLKANSFISESDTANGELIVMSPAQQEHFLHDIIDKTYVDYGVPFDLLSLKHRTVPSPQTDDHYNSVGILLVFHGAPLSDHVYWANRTARKLSLAVTTLDDLILQEAAVSFKSAAIQIQGAINDAFMNQALDQQELDKLEKAGSGVSYEELVERVNFIKMKKPPLIVEKGNKQGARKRAGSKPATPKPGTGTKPGTASAIDAAPTFGNIPEHLYIELIRKRLLRGTEGGMVLESVTGFFLRTVPSALKVILGCAGHISCLEFITFHNTLDQHLTWKWRLAMREDMERQAELQQKILEFEQMTGEQVEALSPDDRKLFASTVLADRQQRLLKCSPSPQSTLMTKNTSINLEKKATKGSTMTKSTKKKGAGSKKKSINSSKRKSSPTSVKTQSTNKSVRSPKKTSYNEELSSLQAEFSTYQNEMEDFIKFLGCWNKNTAEFENVDKKHSLFSVPRPQSKKGKRSSVGAHLSEKLSHPSDVGVSCNVVKVPHNLDKWFDMLIKYLSNTPPFLSSRKKERDWWDFPVPDPLTLRCVKKPDLRLQNTDLDVFRLTNNRQTADELFTLPGDDLSDNISVKEVDKNYGLVKVKTDNTMKSMKSGTKPDNVKVLLQIDKKLQESFLDLHSGDLNEFSGEFSYSNCESKVSDNPDEVLTTSVVLAPGEHYSWRVWYEPRHLSVYHQAVMLEIGGWRKKYKVFLAATCDIPRLHTNPLAIFERVHYSLSPTSISNCVYLFDQRLFYFGPVFATSANKQRTNDLAAGFFFANKSAVDATVNFSFLNDSSSEAAFGFTSESLVIPPRKRRKLEIFACPQSPGKFNETLIVSILNNPEPIFIQMSCIGIKPDFEVEPRVLNFERVLLYRKEICQLNLTNKSYKSMGWKLVGLSELGPQVSVSQDKGVIPALQTTSVYMYFNAQQVEVDNHIVHVLVYDEKFRGEPFLSEPIAVILESVDVLVDLIFPLAKTSELKFEKVKVGITETQTLMLKNKGKYDVTFEIKFNNALELDFKPEQIFSFSPKKGVLLKSGKGFNVNVSCLCKEPVHVNHQPVFKVWLVDSAPTAQPVAAIPINVSINAFTSQFKVVPESELNFGPMLVGSKKVEQIIVQNTGSFEFVCKLMTLEQLQMEKLELLNDEKKENTSKKMKSTKSAKTKSVSVKSESKKGKKTPSMSGAWPSLTAGVFTLSCSGGNVVPGTILTVDVECNALAPDTYAQVQASFNAQDIVIQPMEYPWTKRKPTIIRLIATVYLPCINFDDIGYIFQEALWNSLDTLIDDKQFILYDKESNELRFLNVCVGAEPSPGLDLHLHNSGLVPCDVSAILPTSPFHLTPAQATVMPHGDLMLHLTFQPTQIGEFREELKLQVALPNPMEPKVMTTTLVGKSGLPRVTVTHPSALPDCQPHTSRQLRFPTTLVGEYAEEIVSFVNNGKFPCTVIVEILKDKGKAFKLQFKRSPFSEQGERRQRMVRLTRGETCDVLVAFTPRKVGSHSCELRLYVANNPYEDQTIDVQASGYQEDILIEGLKLTDSRAQLQPLKYELNISNTHVEEVSKHLLVMKNVTADEWYRFQWDEHPSLTFSPSTGHLAPASSKVVWATFVAANRPVNVENEEVLCKLNKIHLNETTRSSVCWDDNQKMEKWIDVTEESETIRKGKRRKRVSYVQEEPQYQVVPASNKTLVVLVTGVIDYARIKMSPAHISFPPTIILQLEERIVKITNIGKVPAEFSWFLCDLAQSTVGGTEKACYGAVSMSRERPRLQPPESTTTRPRLHMIQAVRPATCPTTRPGPIPSSVTLYSHDDSGLQSTSGPQSTPNQPQSGTDWPVTVEPDLGVVLPGDTINCVVRFKPTEIATYSCNFYLGLLNEKPSSTPKSVSVNGSSILPCCHLVVPDCTPANDSQLHIQFRALGIGKPVYKVVSVVNTTDEDYSFHWQEINSQTLSSFSVDTPSSRLNAAKYLNISFSFLPKEAGTFTSQWELTIPERQVRQVVKLTGVSTLPSVHLMPTFIKLPTTLIGVKSEGKVGLVNSEDCDLNYHVVPDSLYCGSWDQTLQMRPMKGVVPAQAQVDLRVWLVGKYGGEGEFRPQVCVERLPAPQTLAVMAACYVVQPQLVFQTFRQTSINISPGGDNIIDIGVVEARIPSTLTFVLTNIGKLTLRYQWSWDRDVVTQSRLSLNATNLTGVLGPQSREVLTLTLTPLARVVISALRLQLEISKGPNFAILLNGTAAQPLFKFSFTKHDFGPCLVQQSDTEFYKTNLIFSNVDEKPLLVECESEILSHLRVGLTQTTVAARSELTVPLVFMPRACQTYTDLLQFVVDGSHHHQVTVTGHGVHLNVMLGDPADKLILLDHVPVGKTKKRCVEVVNKSELSVSPMFSLEPLTPEISLSPTNPITLKPGQSASLTLLFCPKKVVKDIKQELVMQFQEAEQVLCEVSAGSVGVLVTLDRQYVPFGGTIAGNTAATKLVLSNTGDLAVRYSWEVGDEVFTVSPQEGYSGPGTDIPLTVSYSPHKVHDFTQCKAVCRLSDGSQLVASLCGRCVDLPPPTNTLSLSCPVRLTTSTQIPIFNKYGQEVILKVSISGEYFSGNKEISMPPYGTCSYTIVYSPLTVTGPDVHKGVASFYFLDGSCIVYALEGTAGPPAVAEKFTDQLVTHSPHTVRVPVTNWLQIPQKFQVSWLLESSSESKPCYQMSCNQQFQVSGANTRDLLLTFTSHLPGTLTFKVTLTNECTADYLWYLVVLEVRPCGPLQEVRLTSTVREAVTHQLSFHNPLDCPATVTCVTDIPGLSPTNTPLLVQPHQMVSVRFQYLPLTPAGPTTSLLELTSPELGVFPYTVHTTALPPPLPSPLRLTAHLGQTATTTFTLHNHTSQPTVFTCSVNLHSMFDHCLHEDLTVDSLVAVPAHSSVKAHLVYQPSSLANISADLLATSSEAGDFLFPVVCIAKKPNPTGPYNLTPTTSVKLAIKNIFREPKNFVFSTDNPCFLIQETQAIFEPNEVKEVEVQLVGGGDQKFLQYPVTGKLTVNVTDPALCHIQWTFYLQGMFINKSL